MVYKNPQRSPRVGCKRSTEVLDLRRRTDTDRARLVLCRSTDMRGCAPMELNGCHPPALRIRGQPYTPAWAVWGGAETIGALEPNGRNPGEELARCRKLRGKVGCAIGELVCCFQSITQLKAMRMRNLGYGDGRNGSGENARATVLRLEPARWQRLASVAIFTRPVGHLFFETDRRSAPRCSCTVKGGSSVWRKRNRGARDWGSGPVKNAAAK